MAQTSKIPGGVERRSRSRATLEGATEAEFELHKGSHRHLLSRRIDVDRALARRLGLNAEQIEHLAHYGAWYEGLCAGELAPLTALQRHFIDAHYGRVPAQDEHERLWQLWCEARSTRPRRRAVAIAA
jgi:hypothetical protein